MSLRSRMRTWWRAVVDRGAVEGQIDEELRFHIESYAEELMERGVAPEEARRRAKAELGSVAAVRESARQAWGTRWWDELRGDLRYAARMLARSPGFTAIAVGSLALGIGANTAIFSVAQHMLLDRLRVPHPDQLRMFWWSEGREGVVNMMWGYWDGVPGGGQMSTSFSYPVYQALRRENRALADVFAFKPFDRMTVTVKGQAEGVSAEMVSGNYYSTLQVKPQLGRGIEEADDGEVGSGPVVTISDRYWTRRFGRSRDVIGKTLLVNGTPLTIVGVNPPGFTGAYAAQGSPDIFLPFSEQPLAAPQDFSSQRAEGMQSSLLTNTEMWWVLVMGRTKPGVRDAAAEASLNGALNAAVRSTMPVKGAATVPRLLLRDGSRGQNPAAEGLERPLRVLMGLAGFVLLLACANLANLLLARAGARQREMSVRLAMGAGRRRIVRQMMTESLLLSLLGGGAGIAVVAAAHNAIPRLLSNSWDPPAFRAGFSWQILAFAAAASLLTGVIFGVGPAWQATRVNVSGGLKSSERTATRRRYGLAGQALVILQVGISMLLVTGAGLFVQSLMRLERAPLGFNSHHLLLFSVAPPQTRYPGQASLTALEQMEAKVAAVPGVESVTLTSVPLIAGGAMNHTFIPEGSTRRAGRNPSVLANDVGRDFFSTYRIRILAGRGFNTSDTRTSRRVAVINESLAKKFFPNVDPVGRTFETGSNDSQEIEIVGICQDAKYYRMNKPAEPTYYAPYWQETGGIHDATFALATHLNAGVLLPSLRRAVAAVDHDLPLLDVRTQDEQIRASLRQERLFADLTGGFGVLALLLACIGIYGLTAYSVSQRTNEIGIRMALGAERGRVLRMVIREASWLAAIGVAAGLGGALALGRLIASMMYGLKAWDPATLIGAALLLAVVALGASFGPAWRAAKIEPVEALRHD